VARDHDGIVEPGHVAAVVHELQLLVAQQIRSAPPDVDGADRVRGAVHVERRLVGPAELGAFVSVVRSWQERSPGLSLFLPCATTQRGGRGCEG